MTDNVNHPSHYNAGRIETIDAIEDWKLGFNRGNAVKYIARAGRKDPTRELEDLEKAAWYLNRDIMRMKGQRDSVGCAPPNTIVSDWTAGHWRREGHYIHLRPTNSPTAQVLTVLEWDARHTVKGTP